MGVLEEKINRLPPHLQREAEDFIDFLLQRSVDAPPVLPGASILSPVPEPVSAPIIMAQDLTPPIRRQEPKVENNEETGLMRSVEPDDRYERKTGRQSPNKLLDWIN